MDNRRRYYAQKNVGKFQRGRGLRRKTQLFKNALCDTIILDNVTDPVIFSYDGNGENERKVF